jgi:hypothetical protein
MRFEEVCVIKNPWERKFGLNDMKCMGSIAVDLRPRVEADAPLSQLLAQETAERGKYE